MPIPDKLPTYADLPLDPSHPPGSAWGLYGESDNLGTLNLLTPDNTLAAASLIKTGTRISLNWPLQNPSHPGFLRQKFNHKIIQKAPRCVNDDVIEMNTQSGSQWDGLRHFGFQGARKFYGGVTMEDIHKEGSTTLGIHHMAQHGIVGRAVLIDYRSWAVKQGIEYDACSTYSIPLNSVLEIAKEKNITFRQGDILIIRSGFTEAYQALSIEEREKRSKVVPPHFAGFEQSTSSRSFLFDTHFAAIASDAPAFECWPTQSPEGWALHEFVLAGWGMPIGEMFWLEDLVKECERLGRWEFFFVSEPLAVVGGVASPPNALAIF
ncbi:hypothetical protein YB2330_004464 [Saitoella coloradoensis]